MTMKLHLASDLHLEFGPVTLPGGDLLLLAGDVCEAKYTKPTADSQPAVVRDMRARIHDFWHTECAKYQQVYYVMGNHEHYGYTFNKTAALLRQNLPANVQLLEDEAVEVGDWLLVGGTLWTDFNGGDPLTEIAVKSGMNDFRAIQADNGNYYGSLSVKTVALAHSRTRRFIDDAAKNTDKPVMVMTHHAPSFQSVNHKYRGEHLMNGGYASELCDLIMQRENIRYWFHGHMHDAVDYEIQQCRVVANPRGYVGYEPAADKFQVRELQV